MARGPKEPMPSRPTEVAKEELLRPMGPRPEVTKKPVEVVPFGRDPIDLDIRVRPPRVDPVSGRGPDGLRPSDDDDPQVLSGIPEGAHIYPNRSGEEGSGYEEMVGPDIVFHDGVWYAVHEPTGELHPFHVGPHLAPMEQSYPLGDAVFYEATSGTALWNTGAMRDQELRIDGASGDLVTPGGRQFDPDAVAVVRAADGTYLVHDIEAGTFGPLSDLDHTYTAADLPPGPYTTTGGGPGYPPPFDDLAPGTELVYDPQHLRYEDPDTGHVVGFHESQLDGLSTWENRSGDPDSPYQDMQGPDVHYLDGIWYAEEENGTYVPFHEGRYLDLSEQHYPLGDALRYESTAGTPIFGQNPSSYGLVLDGETGGFVDGAGHPVDWATFDPDAPQTAPVAEGDLTTSDLDLDFGVGAAGSDEAGGSLIDDERGPVDVDDGEGLPEETSGTAGGGEAGAVDPLAAFDELETMTGHPGDHLPGPSDDLSDDADPVTDDLDP